MAKSRIRSFCKSFFDVPRWIGTVQLRQHAKYIGSMWRSMFRIPKNKRQDTFESSVAEYRLSDQDLMDRKRYFLLMVRIYLLIAVLSCGYLVYLVMYGHYRGIPLTVVFICLMLSFCFREHFWYVQLCLKRLGVTPKEWFFYLLKRNIE